ncbi:hypothetical protein ES705_41851 [subsurface metagenome]
MRKLICESFWKKSINSKIQFIIMSLKRVLIITYYWPPSGGAGVQRWLKFVKYLPGTGWEPIIYTSKNPESPVEDLSLLKDIPEGITILKRKNMGTIFLV